MKCVCFVCRARCLSQCPTFTPLAVVADNVPLLSSRNDRSFWVTTGVYPQELVLQLAGPSTVNVIKTVTVNGEGACPQQ